MSDNDEMNIDEGELCVYICNAFDDGFVFDNQGMVPSVAGEEDFETMVRSRLNLNHDLRSVTFVLKKGGNDTMEVSEQTFDRLESVHAGDTGKAARCKQLFILLFLRQYLT